MKLSRACRIGLVTVVLAASAAMLAAPGRACACGAAVAPSGTQATFNHEVALVHWDGNTETILMQLAMNASGNNVALVVPTPTPATVTSGDKATFTELNRLTAPRVEQRHHVTLGLGAHAKPPLEAAARPPQVVNQVHLGPLEATTLAGGDLSGLQKWLAENGYAIRPAVSDALGPYVRDGWSFVAMRLTSTDPIVGGLDPVKMVFSSSRVVYPMRLSVAATDPQQVTVFTLADHRQQRTDPDASTQSTEVQYAGNIAGATGDPLLRTLADNHGRYLTKFEVNIVNPERISSDFAFGNAATDDAYRQVIYVEHDVVIPVELVLLAAFVLAAVSAAVAIVLIRKRRRA